MKTWGFLSRLRSLLSMVQPYAYGTEKHTIRVWYVPYAYGTYRTRMVCTIRVRYKILVRSPTGLRDCLQDEVVMD